MKKTFSAMGLVAVGLALGFWLGRGTPSEAAAAAAKNRVFELRTYYTHEGKLPDLQARFRNHTMKLFVNHGRKEVGYWVPQDAPASANTLIYIISHESRDAAKKSWASFVADPDWKKARDASEANGKIVSKLESVFMDATDYSPMK
jgi:hypothetical protein